MVQDTKILYDGDQAIAELKKIADAAKKSANEQVEALDGVEDKLDSLEGAFGKLDPRLGKGVQGLRGIVKFGGAAGVALSGVAVAVAGLAANFVDLPNLLRDSSEEIETFRKNSEKLLELRNASASIGDALAQQGFREDLERLDAQQAAANEQRTELTSDRRTNRDKLRNARSRLRELERLVRDSARRRAKIEKEEANAGIEREIADQTQGTTAGRGVLNLASAAEEAALEGNIEKAKALVKEAKARSKELGDHSLFTKAIANAEGSIQEKNEASNKAEGDRTKQLQEQLKIQRQQVAVLGAQGERINANLAKAAEAAAAVQTERQAVQQQRRDAGRGAAIGQAGRQLDIGIEVLNKQLGTGRTAVEGFRDAIKGIGEAFKRGGPEFEAEVKAINALEERTLSAVNAIAERTPAAIKRGVEGLTTIQEDLRRLQDAGPLSEALSFNVENIRGAIQQALDNIVPATRKAVGAGVQANQPIEPGAVDVVQARLNAQKTAAGIIKNSLERGADASETIKDNLFDLQRASGGQGGRPANVPIPQQQTTPGTSGAGAQSRGQLNLEQTVNIRGGLIDRETQEQLGDIVAQQVRKELAAQGIA